MTDFDRTRLRFIRREQARPLTDALVLASLFFGLLFFAWVAWRWFEQMAGCG